MLGENDCEYCEEKDSVDLSYAEDWSSEYCHECGTLVVTNPENEEVSSSEVPSHLQNTLFG